ncbi:MAG: hypothetical protein H6553_07635 [Chitinophagales bacterium]|nr:hypothetical protein [Chitinophagales bacterium]
MNKLVLLALASFLLLGATTPNNKINLYDAINQKIISVDFKGNEESTHYYEPVVASIQNNTNSNYTIICDNGFLLEPSDAAQQTLIITEEQMISLAPKQKINKQIKAMCIEPNDRSGNELSTYTLTNNTDTLLNKMADFVNKHQYYTACAQAAIWTVVRKNPLYYIYGADTTEANNLIDYIASITGWQKQQSPDSYQYNFYIPPKEKLSGSFTFGFKSAKDIQVAMFNTDGILVRELFNQKQVPPTKNRIEYAFDFNTYTDDTYFVKLIVDNKVLMDRKIDAKSTRDKYKQMWEQQNR